MMETSDLVKLTNSVYKLTLFFPKKDPLRYKVREAATSFLETAILFAKSVKANQMLEEKWQVLQGLLELSRHQNWVQQSRILSIENHYLQILSGFSKFSASSEVLKEGALAGGDTALHKVVKEKAAAKEMTLSASGKDWEREKRPRETMQAPEPIYKPVAQPVFSSPSGQGISLNSRQKEVLRIIQDKKEIKIGELSRSFPNKSRRTLLRDLDLLLEKGLVSKQGNGRGVFYRLQSKALMLGKL